MRLLFLFLTASVIVSCHPHCGTCGTKEEARKFKQIKKQAKKMKRETDKQAKKKV